MSIQRPLSTEQILADAEVCATYLRALVERGVPVATAVALASSYLSAKLISDRGSDGPKEPWEGPGT